jgi:DNA replication protein DnaC
MKWKCEINNPECQSGWIINNGQFKKCPCIKFKAIKAAYLQYAEGEKLMMTPLSKLEDLNVKNAKTSKVQTYKELGSKIIENLPSLIEDQAKIYISGNPGCGKSQFASSLILEAAKKYEYLSYYLPTSRLYEAVFDYGDSEKKKLKEIQEKTKRDSKTKILVLDDIGSEIPKGDDNRMGELLVAYNNILREFLKSNGLLIITANIKPDKLREMYKNDGRLFDVIFQEGSTKYYELTAAAKFRQTKKANSLDLLD